ncbi:hypothetical protein [Arcticibacterium luteifluviistationis]|uniref:UspA domain-containing protein n=1 Tax=Arcticibacterium luteifluviistationis TaxID=1784714 RepID=A0A2Z4GC78_9BACT|nr:hypothetical protein [Arcticibacterium luteifluviistationis]AWV98826.1 hypothetical protein DJ013_11845 [Arcticibacterium luteifluviistationis]
MSEIINIAFCTDFSDLSKASLESIMFNTWDFRCNIHLIHFVEDENEAESKNSLDKLLSETKLIASEGQNILSKIFVKGDLDQMIDTLNNSNYQIIAIGMPFNASRGESSFISMLIERVNKDLTLIPQGHKIKIENRSTIVVDSENLDNLYLVSLFEEFYRFLHTKITIFLLSDVVLEKDVLEDFHEKIKGILPELNYRLINHDRSNCLENLKSEIEKDGTDYLIVFKNDYFENFMLKLIQNNNQNIKWNFSLYRSYSNPDIIENLKKGIAPYPKIELNYVNA